jgi:pyruvate formate-lyase activating enzyme-like uncharacterized protein
MTLKDHPSIQTTNSFSPSYRILNNTTEITTTVLNFFVNVTERLDGFGITDGFPMILENDVVEIISNLKNQGKRIIYITEICKYNLPYCNIMSRFL